MRWVRTLLAVMVWPVAAHAQAGTTAPPAAAGEEPPPTPELLPAPGADTGTAIGDAGTTPSGGAPGTTASPPATPADSKPTSAIVDPLDAPDLLGGHLQLSAGIHLAAPFGHLQQELGVPQYQWSGWGGKFDVGYGVTRNVVLGVDFDIGPLRGGSRCETCDGSTWAAGVFARYHLVQGFRFDPWVAWGLGYRLAQTSGTEETGTLADYSWSGLEWTRLRFGGDWYAARWLGVGPYLGLDLGSYLSRPDPAPRGALDGARVHALFTLGIRIVLDVPGHWPKRATAGTY